MRESERIVKEIMVKYERLPPMNELTNEQLIALSKEFEHNADLASWLRMCSSLIELYLEYERGIKL